MFGGDDLLADYAVPRCLRATRHVPPAQLRDGRYSNPHTTTVPAYPCHRYSPDLRETARGLWLPLAVLRGRSGTGDATRPPNHCPFSTGEAVEGHVPMWLPEHGGEERGRTPHQSRVARFGEGRGARGAHNTKNDARGPRRFQFQGARAEQRGDGTGLVGVERRALRPDAMPPESCLLSPNQPQPSPTGVHSPRALITQHIRLEASREGVSLAIQSDGVTPLPFRNLAFIPNLRRRLSLALSVAILAYAASWACFPPFSPLYPARPHTSKSGLRSLPEVFHCRPSQGGAELFRCPEHGLRPRAPVQRVPSRPMTQREKKLEEELTKVQDVRATPGMKKPRKSGQDADSDVSSDAERHWLPHMDISSALEPAGRNKFKIGQKSLNTEMHRVTQQRFKLSQEHIVFRTLDDFPL